MTYPEMRSPFLIGLLLVAAATVGQSQSASDVPDFISVSTSVFVLDRVRVIDGTGAPAKEDQAIVIAKGKSEPRSRYRTWVWQQRGRCLHQCKALGYSIRSARNVCSALPM